MSHKPRSGTSPDLPSQRHVLLAWALLMALTLGTMLAGKVTSTTSLGVLWTAALLLITGVKARLILSVYLNLRAAPAHWRSGFTATLVLLLLILLGIYAFGFFGLMPGR